MLCSRLPPHLVAYESTQRVAERLVDLLSREGGPLGERDGTAASGANVRSGFGKVEEQPCQRLRKCTGWKRSYWEQWEQAK